MRILIVFILCLFIKTIQEELIKKYGKVIGKLYQIINLG